MLTHLIFTKFHEVGINIIFIEEKTGTPRRKITNVGEDIEGRKPLCPVDSVNWHSHYGKQCGGTARN